MNAEISAKVAYCAGAFSIGIGLALIFLSLHQRSAAWVPLYGVLLLIHPAWTMQVDLSDQGFTMRFFAGVVSLLLVAILICHIFWPQLSRRQFILGLAGIFWIGFLVTALQQVFEFSIDLGTGFAGQFVNTLLVSPKELYPIAIALTLIWFCLWLFNRFCVRRSQTDVANTTSP